MLYFIRNLVYNYRKKEPTYFQEVAEMSNWNWSEFQKKMTTIPPRPILLKALELFNGFKGYAVELGCGSGVDTIHLINSGWKVYTADGTADGFEHIKSTISKDKLSNVEFIHANFENLVIPDADLVYSSYSIPFCRQEVFDTFWSNIVKAVKVGGRFAGHLFGEQDGWRNFIDNITLKTKSETINLFKDFDIEYFDELCEDKPSSNPLIHEIKRWHVFEIIAIKK